jgi:PAS domain S-box-containing protein
MTPICYCASCGPQAMSLLMKSWIRRPRCEPPWNARIPTVEEVMKEVEIRRERQRAEQALQVSEARYRRLFETAQDGILILDAESGHIMDVNPFLVKMLGYPHEDLVGKALWEIGSFKDNDASKSAFRQLQSQGYVRYEDLPLEASDGRRIDVEFVSNVYLVGERRCNATYATSRDARRPRQGSAPSMPNSNKECRTAPRKQKS